MLRWIWIVVFLCLSANVQARGPRVQWDTLPQAVPVAGTIARLDPATGTATEIFRIDHESLTAPSVLGETIYVGASDKSIYALDASTGQKKWEVPTGHFVFFVQATDKAVFIGAGPLLMALKPDTGKLLWKYEADVAVNDLLLVDKLAVINTFDGPIALDQAAGEIRWRVDQRWGYFVFCPLGEGRMSIWKPDEIFVVETERGKTLWTTTADIHTSAPGAIPSPAVGSPSGVICQLRGSPTDPRDWSLHALDAGSGKELWKQHPGPSDAAAPRSIMLAGAVYCSLEESLRKYDLTTGRELWHCNVDPIDARSPFTHCQIPGGRVSLLIPQIGGNLVALDDETGKRLWVNRPPEHAPDHAIVLVGATPAGDGIVAARNELGRPW